VLVLLFEILRFVSDAPSWQLRKAGDMIPVESRTIPKNAIGRTDDVG
jgi:hypothetical protein